MDDRSDHGQTSSAGIDPEVYAEFIRQLHLRDIWLTRTKIENRFGPHTPEHATRRLTSDPRWEATADGFRAFMRYQVKLQGKSALLASIDVTFAVDFGSSQPMTDLIFDSFAEVNLPVNTWPFLREYLATTLGRMNWTPFTLPALKRGTGRRSAGGRAHARPDEEQGNRASDA